jgi:hypothetical protein
MLYISRAGRGKNNLVIHLENYLVLVCSYFLYIIDQSRISRSIPGLRVGRQDGIIVVSLEHVI